MTESSCTKGGKTGIQDLPDEILLLIFQQLAQLGPSYHQEDPWVMEKLPFKNQDKDDMPHPGLRSYPFLGQVCKRWEGLLSTPIATQMLWSSIVVDFGHELVTSIHTPLKWSNRRPSAEEFEGALNSTTLSVKKMIEFIRARRKVMRTLCLCNSEGFWGDENEYLTLVNKHNFQASHLGYILGITWEYLQEFTLYNCNDLHSADQGVWCSLGTCVNLKRLAVEGINSRIATQAIAHLSTLTQLEELVLTAEEHHGQWIVGLDSIPAAWSQLTSLTSLVLRGHQLLDTLPSWLANLPRLVSLDVSNNMNLDVSGVTTLTRLQTLSMQCLELSQLPSKGEAISSHAKRTLPDLTPLAKTLTSLSLADNQLTRLPAWLHRLTGLRILDVSGNRELGVPQPMTSLLAALPHLMVCDFRGVHHEVDAAGMKEQCWGPDKCVTMDNLANAAKQLKRRRFATRFLMQLQ